MQLQADPRRQELLALISHHSCRDDAIEASTLGELEMDSLDTIELCIAIENRFDGVITLDDEIWDQDTTAGQIIDDVIKMLDA